MTPACRWRTRSTARDRRSCGPARASRQSTTGSSSRRPISRWRRSSRAESARVELCGFARAQDLPVGREDRYLVGARQLYPVLREPLGVPVALEVGLRGEHRGLDEVEPPVVRARERPLRGPEVEHRLRGRQPALGELVSAERVDRPVDLHLDHAPTSARIAPGPSAVFLLPSSSAPPRIEILPRCLFSSISWCASGTPSKPSVRHRTGRIWPASISSFARLHSYAFAKCEPMICFWRIHR